MAALVQNLFKVAKQHPAKIAIICEQKQISYSQLVKNVLKWAEFIPQTGDQLHLGILLENSIELVEIFFSIAFRDHILVILDPKWSDHQINTLLPVLPLSCLFTDSKIKARLRPTNNNLDIRCIDDKGMAGGINQLPTDDTTETTSSVTDQNKALFVAFTSGTTSAPKGFIQTQKAWEASFKASQIEFNNNSTDEILIPGPLVHGLSLYPCIEGLTIGATIHILTRFQTQSVIEILKTFTITKLIAVPTILYKIAQSLMEAACPIKPLGSIITAGAKLEKELVDVLTRQFPDIRVFEYYGASELGFVSLSDSTGDFPIDCVGRPFHGCNIEIRNTAGRSVPPCKTGTIWVKSHYIIAGYMNSKDDSGFCRLGEWATVGDMGHLDTDGFLHLKEREDSMLITGGLNVYPSEIENVLVGFIGISDAIVFGLPDVEWGNIICAAIIPSSANIISTDLILDHCRLYLPRYKCPRRFFTVNEFPLTNSGKKSRYLLKQKILDKPN